MATLSEPGILTIMKKSDFLRSRPDGWKMATNKCSNVDDEFTVMVKDSAFEGRDTFCEINNMDELEATRDLIMRRPIFTTARCTKVYNNSNDSQSDSDPSYLTEEYIVLVNTANQEIASQFNRAFELAEQYLKSGSNFRVSICLTESLKDYYNKSVHAPGEDNRLTTVSNCDIHLAHGVKAPNCCDNCLANRTAPNVAFWLVCFPLFLTFCVPYICYKKCCVGLKEDKITQIVPLKRVNGPFEPGYNLVSVLYSPAINYQPGKV